MNGPQGLQGPPGQTGEPGVSLQGPKGDKGDAGSPGIGNPGPKEQRQPNVTITDCQKGDNGERVNNFLIIISINRFNG